MTGTVPPNGPHNQPLEPHDPSGGWQQPAAYYTQPFNPPPPPVRPKGLSTGAVLGILGTVVAVILVAAGVAAVLAPPPRDEPAAAVETGLGSPAPYDALPGQPAPTTAAPTSNVPAAPAGPKTSFGDGVWEVGTATGQVAPGKYRTTVPTSSYGCYWERLSGTGGTFDEIITNGNHDAGTPVIVTIAASDKAFSANQCGTWSKA